MSKYGKPEEWEKYGKGTSGYWCDSCQTDNNSSFYSNEKHWEDLNACNYSCFYLISDENAMEFCCYFSPSRKLTVTDTGEHFEKPFPDWCPLPDAKEQ